MKVGVKILQLFLKWGTAELCVLQQFPEWPEVVAAGSVDTLHW